MEWVWTLGVIGGWDARMSEWAASWGWPWEGFFRLTLAAKYFQRYRVCVRPLGQQPKCKSFPVKKTGASWGGTVVWNRNEPVRGPRGYRVTWRQGATRLGPPLTFYLPAPA